MKNSTVNYIPKFSYCLETDLQPDGLGGVAQVVE
jgi:hypothetical protein